MFYHVFVFQPSVGPNRIVHKALISGPLHGNEITTVVVRQSRDGVVSRMTVGVGGGLGGWGAK